MGFFSGVTNFVHRATTVPSAIRKVIPKPIVQVANSASTIGKKINSVIFPTKVLSIKNLTSLKSLTSSVQAQAKSDIGTAVVGVGLLAGGPKGAMLASNFAPKDSAVSDLKSAIFGEIGKLTGHGAAPNENVAQAMNPPAATPSAAAPAASSGAWLLVGGVVVVALGLWLILRRL